MILLAVFCVLSTIAPGQSASAPSSRAAEQVPAGGQSAAGTSGERGAIRGKVVDYNTGAAVVGAVVHLSGAVQRAAYTMEGGNFAFERLVPSQNYGLSADRLGYLDYSPSILSSSSRIEISPGQVRDDIVIRLVRGGVIGGQVLDESGEPVEGMPVHVGRLVFLEGRRQVAPVGFMQRLVTDDEGRFRVPNLRAGRYVVWAEPRDRQLTERVEGPVPAVYVKTYALGTTDVGSAMKIDLEPGARSLGANISLARGRLVTLSGLVTTADGSSAPGRRVILEEYIEGVDFVATGGSAGYGLTDANGRFVLRNIRPGTFSLTVEAARATDGTAAALARTPVIVADADITDLVLREAVVTVKVRLVRESGEPSAGGREVSSVDLRPEGYGPPITAFGPSVDGHDLSASGEFVLRNVPAGKYRLHVQSRMMGLVRGVRQGAEDVTDSVIDLRSDVPETELVVEVRSRPTLLEVVVSDAGGHAVEGSEVVVFSTTPERWWLPESRYVGMLVSSQAGKFMTANMPPGDYFVAVATENLDDNLFGRTREIDPEILERLRGSATVVSLAEDQTTKVSLRSPQP